MSGQVLSPCDEGDTLIGGGCVITSGGTTVAITGSFPDVEFNTWSCFYSKTNPGGVEILARALCYSN
jgi:hypothetical protein